MDAKNRQIIDVAIDMFSERGFHQTTMQDIAETAGVGKGTIYRFFESKEDLISSLVEFAIEDITREIQSAIEKLSHPVEKLRSIIAVEVDYYDQHRNLAKFLVREVLGYRNKFEDHIKKIHSTRAAIVERVIQEGMDEHHLKRVNPATLAASLEGMVLASVIFWFMFSDSFPTQEIQNDIYTALFEGILVNP